MKKTKIFALVLTLALLVTQFAMLGSVPASATGGIDDIPAWPSYDHVELLKSNTANWWGGSGGSSNNNHLVTGLTPVDMSATQQVELDVYIDNYAGFSSATSGKGLYFRFGDANDYYIEVSILDQITGDGWNHVEAIWLNSGTDYFTDRTAISNNSIDLTAICWVKMYSTAGIAWDVCGKTRIANVCFTMKEINRVPDWPTYEHIEILKAHGENYWGSANSSNHLVTGLSETDMSETAQVEFDLYIHDYDSYASQTAGGNVYFRFGSQGDNYIDLDVKSKITHDGWNHVVAIWLPSSADADTNRVSVTGSPVLTAVRWVKIFCSKNIDWEATRKIRLANVCFTKKEIDRIPAWPSYEHVEILKQKAADYWGGSAGNDNHRVTGLEPVNMNGTEQVEFDVYIENYANFASEAADASVRFRFGSGTNYGSNYIEVNVRDKITHDGWNHVRAVWLHSNTDPNTDRYTLQGDPVLGSITWVKLYCTKGITWNVAGKTRLANVCFTKKATFQTKSLVLTDRIGLNFFMDLSKLSAEQKNGSYMTFAVTNKADALQDEYDSADVNGSGYNCFTCQLSSMEMAETVTPTFHYGTGETVTGPDYSVKDYIDYVSANPATFDSKVIKLAKALGDYGHYAQVYLGGRNSWSAGTDYTAIGKYRAEDYGSSDYSTKSSVLSSAAPTKEIDGTAVTGISYSLNFDSKTYVNVELATTDSLIASATVDGKMLYLSSSGKVRTQGLPILKLGTPIAITGRGSANTKTFTVTLSGLSYIRAILNSGSTSAAAKNAVSALHDYYTAARAYAGV